MLNKRSRLVSFFVLFVILFRNSGSRGSEPKLMYQTIQPEERPGRPLVGFRLFAVLFVMIALPALFCRQAAAQETGVTAQVGQGAAPDPPAATAPVSPVSQAPDSQNSGTPKTSGGTSKDRLFFALPNFLTLENAGDVPPLTVGQKFKVVARSTFDPVEYFWYGALAGISQWENSEPGFGQGAQGYGKRYGAYLADGTIENFMTEAILPSLLHQDPRYYQMGKGGFWHRTGYAISRIFITRTDSGGSQFNFSEVLGSAMASGISTYSYHPGGDRNVPNTLSVWGTQVGYDTLTLVVKEFWPDIRRRLHRSQASQGH
jgi:hypothetical protein